MKVTQVEFSRLFSIGNFENKKIGLTIVLEGDETPAEALVRAEQFVQTFKEKKTVTEYAFLRAKEVLKDPDNYTGMQVKEAKRVIEQKESETDIPF